MRTDAFDSALDFMPTSPRQRTRDVLARLICGWRTFTHGASAGLDAYQTYRELRAEGQSEQVAVRKALERMR